MALIVSGSVPLLVSFIEYTTPSLWTRSGAGRSRSEEVLPTKTVLVALRGAEKVVALVDPNQWVDKKMEGREDAEMGLPLPACTTP